MSQSDSFIEEVTQDLRRDRLFRLMRRYGWIAIAAVVALVAIASWNEYRKATERAEAQAFGDALLSAAAQGDAAARADALQTVAPGSPAAAVLVAMRRADALAEAGDTAGAQAVLEDAAAREGLEPLYRDLARLKLLALRGDAMAPEARRAALAPLTEPGAPYRALALEHRALAELDAGDTEAAIATLREILAAEAASQGLRARAQQLLVALGAEAPA